MKENVKIKVELVYVIIGNRPKVFETASQQVDIPDCDDEEEKQKLLTSGFHRSIYQSQYIKKCILNVDMFDGYDAGTYFVFKKIVKDMPTITLGRVDYDADITTMPPIQAKLISKLRAKQEKK